MKSRDQLMAFLAELGIETTTADHAPVYTVEDAKAMRGELAGGHTKNLFLKDKKGGLWLVVCLEDRRVDLTALSKRLAAPRFSFGKAELLVDVWGVEPGSVTPLGAINDTDGRVTVVLDQGMMALSPLNFHPLQNDATTQILPDDLVKFLQATGHEPIISEIDERPE